MAVAWLAVDVRVWHSEGKRVPDTAFLGMLAAATEDAVVKRHKSREPWQAARVTLVAARAEDFAAEEEPSEAFAEVVRGQLLRAAGWLDAQPVALFAGLRQDGYKVDVFIEAWIDRGQFEVELPPEFVAACGRLGLGVSLLTNG